MNAFIAKQQIFEVNIGELCESVVAGLCYYLGDPVFPVLIKKKHKEMNLCASPYFVFEKLLQLR
jgi:hypothetical protein